MGKRPETRLSVNGTSVELTAWPEELLQKLVVCAVTSLKQVTEITELSLQVEGDRVSLTVNGEEIPLRPFPSAVLAGTFKGRSGSGGGADHPRNKSKLTVTN